MRDIDLLGELQRGRPSNVRVVTLEERPPGDLDSFWIGAEWQFETGVQVIGGDVRRAHEDMVGRGFARNVRAWQQLLPHVDLLAFGRCPAPHESAPRRGRGW